MRSILQATLDHWREEARKDDCLDRVFVPSDIRQMIGEIDRLKCALEGMTIDRDNAANAIKDLVSRGNAHLLK